MKRFRFLILPLLVWSACTDPTKGNPFAELLNQPPYKEWTDQIKNEPGNDSLLYQRGSLLLSNGQIDAARIDLEKAWSINPRPQYTLELNATLGSKTEQVSFLRKALTQFGEYYPIEFALADALLSMDSVDAAILITKQWIPEGIQDPEYLLLHASLLNRSGQQAESIKLMESVYSLEPNYRPVMEILALQYANMGDEKVLPICQKLKDADSVGKDATPYYYLGIYYASKKQASQALKEFDQAIRTDYNFIEAYIEKAALLYDKKEFMQGIEVLGKALAVAPDHALVYYWTAKCQLAMGDRANAKLNFLKAYGLDQTLLEAKQAADALK